VNNQGKMHSQISLITAFRFLFHGRWATRIITIILSSFAFMLFSIGSMGFTTGYTDYMTRALLNYYSDKSYVCFWINGGVAFSEDEINSFENTLQTELIYTCNEIEGYSWTNYLGSYNLETVFRYVDCYSYNSCIAGSEENYRAMGFELLGGRFPSAENEIAITENYYAAFQQFGYRDGDEIVSVKTYDDMLNRLIGSYSYNFETRTEERVGTEYTIVGVVDTFHRNVIEDKEGITPSGRLLLSAESKTKESVNLMYMTENVHDYKTLRKAVELSFFYREEYGKESGKWDGDRVNFYASVYDTTIASSKGEVRLYAAVLGAAGVFFGIFAALLNGHLTTLSIEGKRKKVGILRSMGADKKTIWRVFLVDVLFAGACIFVVALCMTCGVYFGWLRAWMSARSYGVTPCVLSGWTVLILAAICFGVPLISSLLPLHKFFKKSIVENISGNESRQKKR